MIFFARYILDCRLHGRKLDHKPYLLPAGRSTLLMQEVEQGGDYRNELRINGCLLPSPVATRKSSKEKTICTFLILKRKNSYCSFCAGIFEEVSVIEVQFFFGCYLLPSLEILRILSLSKGNRLDGSFFS